MNNSFVAIVLTAFMLCCYGLVASDHSNGSDSCIKNHLYDALKNPYQFIETNKAESLLALLLESSDRSIIVIPVDSLEKEMESESLNRLNSHSQWIRYLLMYVQSDKKDAIKTCSTLLNAGDIAFWRLNKPALALQAYELAEYIGCEQAAVFRKDINRYVKQLDACKPLLIKKWSTFTVKEKHAYIGQLKEVLKENPQPLLETKIFTRMGDVYYTLSKYPLMIKWYSKAVAIDSTLMKSTPIGYRIGSCKKVVFRNRLLTVIYIGYFCILLCIIVVFQKRQFLTKHFFPRLVWLAPLFVLFSLLFFALDFYVSSPSIESALNSHDVALPKPIVPFSIIDRSAGIVSYSVIAIGFLCSMVALLLNSFAKPLSRIFRVCVILILSLLLWTHLIIHFAFDQRFEGEAHRIGAHLYFDGELELLLKENPEKVMKANPRFLKNENQELKEFIKDKEISIGR